MSDFQIHLQDGRSFTCSAHDTLTRAGLRAGLAMPYECNAGGCGTCRYELLEGEVDDLYPAAPALTERDRRKGRRLGCQSVPRSDLTVRVQLDAQPSPAPAPRRVLASLVAMADITHDIREFRFRLAEPLRFLPGQYALIEIAGVGRARAYSMSNIAMSNIATRPDACGDEWHFQIRRVPEGRATAVLFDRFGPGMQVVLDGPYGNAYLREDAARDIVCVAGGSGLSPMLSIARGAAASSMLAGRRVRFFMGGRTQADIGGERELRALPGFNDTITFHPAVSVPEPHHAWSGATGFVHDVALATIEAAPAEHEWYFAGPPPMVAAVEARLREAGVPQQQLHFDRYF
ncbi:2Fe-2S iron-sulfur cluster-binding protein [Paraburkholderia jirisanensis]